MSIMILKTIHIICACLFFGGGILSVYYKLRADRCEDMKVKAWFYRELVRADMIFTVPSGILIFITGVSLVMSHGFPWNSQWVVLGLCGYFVAVISWIPGAFMQIKVRNYAQEALQKNLPMDPNYKKANRIWMLLGIPAFSATIFVIWTMITKT